jgi:glycosyltransferase involved in cell wall biosynthesis
MKVLLVHDYATATGGAEIQLLNWRAELRRRGHDVRLFASVAGREAGDGQAEYDCFGTLSSGRTLLQTANVGALRALERASAAFEPDVVHVTMFLTQLSPLILRALRNIPCIYQVVWHRPMCPLGTKLLPDGTECRYRWGGACYQHGCLPLRDWLPLMLQKAMLDRWKTSVDLYVANSQVMKAALIEHGFDPVTVLWNGTPEVPARLPLEGPPSVAFVGRLVREKGVDVALHAFARTLKTVPGAQFVVVGDGPERAALERLVSTLQLDNHVKMLGHLPHAAAEAAVSQCWVQVAPSRWVEPFGLVAIEAQMRGTAIVAHAAGGFLETVEDGRTGVLVPMGDDDAWVRALVGLLGDRDRAEAMGRAGRERARELFSERAIADQLVDIYHQVIGECSANLTR